VNDSPIFDQTISDLNFWHRTGTTLVGILHENHLTLSPGPYAKIYQNDTLYFVGDELSFQNVYNLFYE
jgi:K+/H+ antiporter YhaU regulatory subunit KhtT